MFCFYLINTDILTIFNNIFTKNIYYIITAKLLTVVYVNQYLSQIGKLEKRIKVNTVIKIG